MSIKKPANRAQEFTWHGGTCHWRIPSIEYETLFEADYYAVPKKNGINLNKASIPSIIVEVLAKVENKSLELSTTEDLQQTINEITITARNKAALLLGANNTEEILFTRNSTEAIDFSYWLAGQYLTEQYSRAVMLSDAENPSVYRSMHINLDSGNPQKKDPITTYSNITNISNADYKDPDEWFRHKAENICIIGGYIESEISEIREHIEEIMSHCHKAPSLLTISHVLRHNGRVMPIKNIIKATREIKRHHYPNNPDIFACVDGAMAFGNLPKIDINDLDCDMYVTSPHKTLGSPALGVARINMQSPIARKHLPIFQKLQNSEQIILQGMFDPGLEIPSNTPGHISPLALYGFSATLDYLESNKYKIENRFYKLALHRQIMKNHAKSRLKELKKAGIPIKFYAQQNGSPFILSFNLFAEPGFEPEFLPGFESISRKTNSREKDIAQELDKRNIALSFIRRGKIFRISFHYDTTFEDIDKFIEALKDIIL